MAYFNIEVGNQNYQARRNNLGGYDIYDPSGSMLPGWSAGQYGNEIQIRQGDNPVAIVDPTTSAWSAPGTSLTGSVTPVAPEGTVTTPNVPVPRDTAEDLAGGLGDMLPMYQNSLQNLLNLPENIDEWLGDIVGRYKVTGRDMIDTFNKAANARAGRGIMGGTQAENLNANLLSGLRRDVQDKQTTVLADALKLKASAILGTPSATRGPLEIFNQLYGTQANEALGWGNIAAGLIQRGYTG